MNSTDERIEEIRRKKQAQVDAAEQARKTAEEANRQQAERRRLLDEKWTADTHVIKDASYGLEQKLAPEGMKYSLLFKPANPGTSVGTAEINGKAGAGPNRKMVFNAFEAGEVNVYFDNKVSTKQFDLLTATKETYEQILLDLFERASGNS